MPTPFQLCADHPALDLVNTLDNRFVAAGPNELLGSYADLLAFMRQASLIDSRRINALATRQHTAAATKALRSAQDLREALAGLLYGNLDNGRKPQPEHIKTLERHFIDAARHRELTWPVFADSRGSPRAVWDWGRFATHLELPVWILAESAQSLLTSSTMDHVHRCHSDTCRWLFMDSTKNHSRRWCDMAICGNRMKARRFHAKLTKKRA